jgi:hypothetical protein
MPFPRNPAKSAMAISRGIDSCHQLKHPRLKLNILKGQTHMDSLIKIVAFI